MQVYIHAALNKHTQKSNKNHLFFLTKHSHSKNNPALSDSANSVPGVEQLSYKAVAAALEVIPRTLAQNCGANVIRTLTKLRAKHADPGNTSFGINGHTGEITDMRELGVWEPYAVKVQTIKTAVESACMLLRIDDIVSGIKKARVPWRPFTCMRGTSSS